MKIRRIPAQITTVEDKIAGSLNLTQMTLLIIPVFVFMAIYVVFAPSMQFAWYKIPLFILSGSIPPILAIRIKEKIVLTWLVILLRYNLRPAYYLFNKNDSYLRTMNIITIAKKDKKITAHAKEKQQTKTSTLSFGDLVRIEGLLANSKYSFSIKSQKKGAFHVAFEQKQK
ncbi:MAG TPA: hypothetical protein VNW29_05560 [Candidatus Sulfotelmatobacter sp.]|jgi:hypothetical protein|nr:hypothetical protein [Candidatus Sulfotelmatobacter sp.]